jgi:hypothetical protein
MRVLSLRCFVFAILWLFVDLSGAEDITIYANDSRLYSNPL